MSRTDAVSLNLCRPTLRGIGDTPPENAWFPVWLLCRHINFTWDEIPDFLIFGDTGNGEHLLYPTRTIRIFVTGENITANWAEADYAFTHERTWSDRHWRVPLWRHWYDTQNTKPMRDFAVVRARVDRFCNFIYSNEKAVDRIRFFKKLNRIRLVDACGRLFNNIGGPVEDKRSYLSRCKFTIAFENESHPGYATEKIIEPLLMGSIPIYWGDPQIEEDFNPDSFINVHRFKDFDAVIEEVLRIDEDDSLWEKYVTAPIFRNGQFPQHLTDEAIVAFCQKIFSEKKNRIGTGKKTWQRIRKRTRENFAVQKAINITRRVMLKISRIASRIVQIGS